MVDSSVKLLWDCLNTVQSTCDGDGENIHGPFSVLLSKDKSVKTVQPLPEKSFFSKLSST